MRNQVNQYIRKIKEDYWEGFSKNLEHDFCAIQKQFWRFIRNQKKEMKAVTDVSKVKLEEWSRCFPTLCNKLNEYELFPNTQMITNDSKIQLTNADAFKAMKTLRNIKSAASDGIYNEILKYGGEMFAEQINMLFNKILNNHQIRQEWRISIVTALLKTGDKSNPKN
jgi:hypothetical protein